MSFANEVQDAWLRFGRQMQQVMPGSESAVEFARQAFIAGWSAKSAAAPVSDAKGMNPDEREALRELIAAVSRFFEGDCKSSITLATANAHARAALAAASPVPEAAAPDDEGVRVREVLEEDIA